VLGARDRAPLPRAGRLPRDHREPGARPRDDRPLPGRHQQALGDLFGQVLGLCADAGLVDAGLLAVDGTRLAAAASNHANRSYEEIAREIVARAGEIDTAEDERHGERRGDELPERPTTRDGRRAWLREAKERVERERAADPKPVPRDRRKRPEDCHGRLVEDWRAEHRANRDYEAWRERGVMSDGRRFGAPPKPNEPPERPEGKINTTDPDSKTRRPSAATSRATTPRWSPLAANSSSPPRSHSTASTRRSSTR
jgi:hypothetical protein